MLQRTAGFCEAYPALLQNSLCLCFLGRHHWSILWISCWIPKLGGIKKIHKKIKVPKQDSPNVNKVQPHSPPLWPTPHYSESLQMPELASLCCKFLQVSSTGFPEVLGSHQLQQGQDVLEGPKRTRPNQHSQLWVFVSKLRSWGQTKMTGTIRYSAKYTESERGILHLSLVHCQQLNLSQFLLESGCLWQSLCSSGQNSSEWIHYLDCSFKIIIINNNIFYLKAPFKPLKVTLQQNR